MIQGKKILAIVPARGGSKGIPLKNLQKLAGISLIEHVAKTIKDVPTIDRAILSTDHEEIAKVGISVGLDVPFYRPALLSGDCVSDLDVLTHAILAAEEKDQTKYEVILMLQPTSPLRKPKHIQAVIELLITGHYDSVWTVSETDIKYHPLKQLVFNNSKLSYFDQKASNIIARQQLEPVFHRNGAAYAFTRECILNQKVIMGLNSSAVLVREKMISIDTMEDMAIAEKLIMDLK